MPRLVFVPDRKGRRMARNDPRGPQGKRLGKWKHVKKKDLIAYLERKDTTAVGLAKQIGVTESAVAAWRAGRRNPSTEAQKKLALFFAGGPEAAPATPRNGYGEGLQREEKKPRPKARRKVAVKRQPQVKRNGVTLKDTGKSRTRRKVLSGDFSDTTFCTSLDWPADIYVLAKAVSEKRGVPLNEVAFEAVRVYLRSCPELEGVVS